MDDTLKLVEQTIQGDVAAWTALQALLDPVIVRIARRHHSLRRKGIVEADDISDVRTAALERLASKQFNNLRSFMERSAQRPQPESFDSWLYGVVDFAIRDHVRKRFGRAPKLPAAQSGVVQPSKRDLQSQAGRLDDEQERRLLMASGVTTRMALAEILAFMRESFTPDELHAAQLYYMEGRDYAEIARSVDLDDAKAAEQLIRRLNARLRYRFSESAGTAD